MAGYSAQKYLNAQVTTSSSPKLVVMLYDGAISFLNQAKSRARTDDMAGKGMFILKAQDIIMELNNALNMQAGGEIARNLRRLYLFMNRHIIAANIKKDETMLNDVIKMLTRLKKAWETITENKDTIPPQLQNRPALSMGINI